jgi:hypothetical protein
MQAKMEVDRRKSHDLLAAGYRVVRLREDDLPKLGIDLPHYLELQVYSTAPRPNETFSRIKEWLAPAVMGFDGPRPLHINPSQRT